MCIITEGDFNAKLACAQRGCRECQDRLVRENKGLIYYQIRKTNVGDVPYAELEQLGRIALWQAILHFDPQRGTQFGSYASRAIQYAYWRAGKLNDRPQGYLPAPETAEPGYERQHEAVQQALATALQQLSPRAREVLSRHYGLGDQPPLSLAALGREWGLTRERMRQLREAALDQLRAPGFAEALYQACERDTRTAYLQRLALHRAWRRGQR